MRATVVGVVSLSHVGWYMAREAAHDMSTRLPGMSVSPHPRNLDARPHGMAGQGGAKRRTCCLQSVQGALVERATVAPFSESRAVQEISTWDDQRARQTVLGTAMIDLMAPQPQKLQRLFLLWLEPGRLGLKDNFKWQRSPSQVDGWRVT